MTQEALAQRLGKSQSTIANKMRLLKLPESVQQALLAKKITERHARALIALKDAEKQELILQEIIDKELNVKETEAPHRPYCERPAEKETSEAEGYQQGYAHCHEYNPSITFHGFRYRYQLGNRGRG